jgi:AcrR family transcriptional regulator
MTKPWKHPKTGVYWFRKVVPAALRQAIGRTEFRLTLGTKDRREAEARYPVVAERIERILADARGSESAPLPRGTGRGSKATSPYSRAGGPNRLDVGEEMAASDPVLFPVVPLRPSRRRKSSRAEKLESNRKMLFESAASVVGAYGYADASIARITERANVAQGTFYRYFHSRQDLFDQLLPYVGADLIHALGERVAGARDIFDVEERGIRGFFDYLADHPGFYRLLNEAEFAAPRAFWTHMNTLTKHYVGSLHRSWSNGELPGYEARELEVLAYILMAARFYLYLRFSKSVGGARRLPEWVIRSYLKFITGGLRGDPFGAKGRATRRMKAKGRRKAKENGNRDRSASRRSGEQTPRGGPKK